MLLFDFYFVLTSDRVACFTCRNAILTWPNGKAPPIAGQQHNYCFSKYFSSHVVCAGGFVLLFSWQFGWRSAQYIRQFGRKFGCDRRFKEAACQFSVNGERLIGFCAFFNLFPVIHLFKEHNYWSQSTEMNIYLSWENQVSFFSTVSNICLNAFLFVLID